MNDSFKRPEGLMSLEDQAFLRELGISGLPQGLEYALEQHRASLAALEKIERRANGLQSLDLDETTRQKLIAEAEQKGLPKQEPPSFFRDIEDKPFPE